MPYDEFGNPIGQKDIERELAFSSGKARLTHLANILVPVVAVLTFIAALMLVSTAIGMLLMSGSPLRIVTGIVIATLFLGAGILAIFFSRL